MFWVIYIIIGICFWPIMYRIVFKAVEGHFGIAYDGDRIVIAIWAVVASVVWFVVPPVYVLVWVFRHSKPLFDWLER